MRQSRTIKGYKQLRIGRYSFSGRVYFITTTTMGRKPIFKNDTYARVAIEAFTLPALLKDTHLLCWVLMPDHAHWLIELGQTKTLSSLVASMKSASARHVRRAGHRQTVWAKGFHDRALKKSSEIPIVMNYIWNNPLKAGLPGGREGYLYSSRTWHRPS